MVTTRSGATSSGGATNQPRRSSDATTHTPLQSKRSRIKRQSAANREGLSPVVIEYGLLSMPVEVFAEIARQVLPGDLIALARTCKAFRSFLMKRSTENIWRCAEGNLPGLPSYDWPDMCPPRYAALLFSKYCTFCGGATSTDVDSYLLLRLCPGCREAHLVEIDEDAPMTKAIYGLINKTDLVRMKKHSGKKQDAITRVYCLRTELERTRNTYKMTRKADGNECYMWEEGQMIELDMRVNFAQQLRDFLESFAAARREELQAITEQRTADINQRLEALGWSDEERNLSSCPEWNSLVLHPRPLTDRAWNNLLLKLTPLLEANRMRVNDRASELRRTSYATNLYACYHLLLYRHCSLTPIVKALGFTLEDPHDFVKLPCRLCDFIGLHPFPDASEVLSWPWLEGAVDADLTLEKYHLLMIENWDDAISRISELREDIAQRFHERLVTGRSGVENSGALVSDRLELDGSDEPTNQLSRHARSLLRADSVFSLKPPGAPDGQGDLLYYPELDSIGTLSFVDFVKGKSREIKPELYHPHLEAWSVSRALLEGLGMRDATYIELAIKSRRFVCGRCHTKYAMKWVGLVQHYVDELEHWKVKEHVVPRFKTRHPVPYLNAHDLNSPHSGSPLARIITTEEVEALDNAESNFDALLVCVLCKNYSRTYVAEWMHAMEVHQREVHKVHTIVQNDHYEIFADHRQFLQHGAEWAKRWDLSHDNLQPAPLGTD